MQDRFKSRVWDKENKCMHYSTRYSNFAIVNGTVVKIESYPTANSAYYGKRIAWEFNDAVIMQSTGLKDKNGKLIYEGDILQLESFIEENVVHICFWNEEGAEFLYEPIIKGDKNAPLRGIEEFAQDSEYILDEIPEIIGNIYENPELLETKEK